MSSLSIVIGETEQKLITRFEERFKRTLLLHYRKHWLQSKDCIELGDYVTGIDENTSRGAGFASTPYTLSPDLTLKMRPNQSLFGFKDWIQNLIARLGPSHKLSTKLNSIVIGIGDDLPKIYAEQSKLLVEAVRASEAVSTQGKRLAATEASLRTQISLAESRAHDAMAAKEIEFKKLEEELASKSAQIRELTSAASGQAQSLRSLTSMSSLDDAAHLTIQMFGAVEATLEQLSMLDVSVQAVRQHKDSVTREVLAAKSHLTNLMSDEWLRAQAQTALSQNTQVGPVVNGYIRKIVSQERARTMRSQAIICRDYVDDIISALREYDNKISNQWFKTFRRGFKVKKPIIDSLIETLTEKRNDITDDGLNARAILEEVRTLIISRKQKSGGTDKKVYRKGNNFKAVIDSALSVANKALDGRVSAPGASVAVGTANSVSVDDINSNAELCERLQAQNMEVLCGDRGLPTVIKAEVSSALTSMERAAELMNIMGESVEKASQVRSQFIKSMETSFDRRQELPGGVESVQCAMQTARDKGHLIKALLNKPQAPERSNLGAGAMVVRQRSVSSEPISTRTVQALTLH